MDQLIKQQSIKAAHKESKPFIYPLLKGFICVLTVFAALSIGSIVLFADNQNSRKLFGGQILQIFVQYPDGQQAVAIEVDSAGLVGEIMEAEQIDGKEFVLTHDGKELCPTDGIADSGISAESVVFVAQNQLYSYLDNAIGDVTNCIGLGFDINSNLERIEYQKRNVNIDEALRDVPADTEYFNLNETNIESFREFQERVNEYLIGRGFARTDFADYKYAEYCVEQWFIQVDADNSPIFVKFGNQITYQSIEPYLIEQMKRFEKGVAEGHAADVGYTLEKSSVIEDIETHEYRLVDTLRDRRCSVEN